MPEPKEGSTRGAALAGQRGADALARALADAGVRRLFTLSGNHVMPVFDAALDAGIDLVHTRHEAAAVHMADAWARLTGEPGIALVTGGPGHANALSALYTAQMAESPVVLLSGCAPTDQLGMGAFQEMRQAEMAGPVSKASWTVAGAGVLAADMARAVRLARSGRPGPVHLSLPTDTLEALAPATASASAESIAAAAAFSPEPMPLAATDAIAILARLSAAARPLVLAGPACMTRAGRARMRRLEAAAGIPVVGMESPRGIADPCLGAFAEVLGQADCILLLGKRMDFTLRFGRPPALAADCRFLQVDPEPAEVERTRRAVGERLERSVIADASRTLDALTGAAAASGERGRNDETPAAPPGGWSAEVAAALAYRPRAWDDIRCAEPGKLHPVQACRPLQALLDSHADSVLVVDGGEFGQWAQACLSAPARVINGVAGSIGSALPFALGARLACPDAPVVALMGDGTFGFHVAEIDTAIRYGLAFVVVIGNDARWNAEYQIQLAAYGPDRLIGCELRPLHYDAIAAAFGGYGERVTDASQMPEAVQRAYRSALPAVLDVQIAGEPAPQVRRGARE